MPFKSTNNPCFLLLFCGGFFFSSSFVKASFNLEKSIRDLGLNCLSPHDCPHCPVLLYCSTLHCFQRPKYKHSSLSERFKDEEDWMSYRGSKYMIQSRVFQFPRDGVQSSPIYITLQLLQPYNIKLSKMDLLIKIKTKYFKDKQCQLFWFYYCQYQCYRQQW